MKSIEELKAIRESMQNNVGLRDDDKSIRIVVGMATCGITAGARPVLNALTEEVAKRNLKDVMVTQTGCIGLCRLEPIVEVFEGDQKTTYVKMTRKRPAASSRSTLSTNRWLTSSPSAPTNRKER